MPPMNVPQMPSMWMCTGRATERAEKEEGKRKARDEKEVILAYFAAFTGCGIMARLPPVSSHAERQQVQAATDARAHRCGRRAHDGRGWPRGFRPRQTQGRPPAGRGGHAVAAEKR